MLELSGKANNSKLTIGKLIVNYLNVIGFRDI